MNAVFSKHIASKQTPILNPFPLLVTILHLLSLIRKCNLMDAFVTTTAIPAPLRISNVDTDMIIPAEHLKTIERTGLGKHAFSRLRYDKETGEESNDFVLNQPMYRGSSILLAEDNFGCGSSREHAPWALLDMGIKCVVSTSFADIFFNNCFKNGILPIRVSQTELGELFWLKTVFKFEFVFVCFCLFLFVFDFFFFYFFFFFFFFFW